MPRRNIGLTVVLGDGPETSPSGAWDSGIAVAADGNTADGMMLCRPATEEDDIIGWTIRPQLSGDVAPLRTMLDGTIEIKLGTMRIAEDLEIGDPLWLMVDGSGRLTDNEAIVSGARPCALALERNKDDNTFCEVFVKSQKYIII